MKKILVENFAATSCNGTFGAMPGVIKDLARELNADVEYIPYPIWDMNCADGLPYYLSARLAKIRNGEQSTNGLFIEGEWFDLRHHNASDVIKIRRKLIGSAELNPDEKDINLLGWEMKTVKTESSSIDEVHFSNSAVSKEMGSFSTDFEAVWFFEGSIKKLSIDNCKVENFTYRGYDINKLTEIADKHPELFKNKETGDDAKTRIQKANIDDVKVMLVTADELNAGSHPCFLAGSMASFSKKYRAIAEKFGGWGYKAVHGKRVCGWMGIATKDILHRDLGYMAPCEIPEEAVLCLTCYMGGGNYAPEYHRIGIAKKMINQAITDAKAKGYRRVEAYPHPEIIPVLEKCGFLCDEIKNNGVISKYYYYDTL